MTNSIRSLLAVVVCFGYTLSALADPQWYQQLYPSNSNSQINLKDQSGNTVTAIRNPTAATVQLNANNATQPPSVFVQATATLPVVTIGTTCDSTKDTAALSAADRLTLLTCPPTNLWTIAYRSRLRTVNEGDVCNITTDGNLAVNSSGLALSCQSGVWKANSPVITATQGTNACGATNMSLSIPAGHPYHLNVSGWCWGTGNQCQLAINGAVIEFQQNPSGWGANVASGFSGISAGTVTASILPVNTGGTVGCFQSFGRIDAIYN